MGRRALTAGMLMGLALPALHPRPVSPQEILELVSAHKGKVVLLNFWASWCPPCLEEFPLIVELEKRYRERGLVVVSVASEPPQRVGRQLPAFLEKHRPGFEVYRLQAPDPRRASRLIDPEWTGKLPATFFFDRQGRPSVKRYSAMSRREMVRLVEYLLAEPAH